MCGIALSVGLRNSREVVTKILQYQQLRGPDHSALLPFSEGQGFIGHNRLNIVDQNSASNQPFISSCGNYLISFNGEIYNYKDLAKRFLPDFKFKTKSDTEVLIELWAKMGHSSIQHLIGMFAFIVYSKKEKKIYVVRDRYGVKPIYYYSDGGSFTVSSELNSLSKALAKEGDIDFNVLGVYLDQGIYDSLDDKTHIKNIKKIPAGSILIFRINNNDFDIIKYWNYELVVPKPLTEKDIFDVNYEINLLLKDAVRLRTNSSVPFVINMSGGVDSGALLALLKGEALNDHSRPLLCYSARFSGPDANRESENLKVILKQANVDCRFVDINFNNLKDKIDKLVSICDGPIGGFATLGYYQLHQAMHKDGYRLAIDGQGADEVFLGYDKYLQSNDEDTHVDGTKNSYFSIFSKDFKNQLIRSFPKKKPSIYSDLFFEKLPRNLRMNDRLSMSSSVELRSPFLDHRLYEKSFILPRQLYTSSSSNLKYQIKKIYTDYYGKKIPKKNGKVTNQTESLLSENYFLIENSLERLASIYHGEIDVEKVRKLLKHFKISGIDNSFQLWRIIVSNSIIDSSSKN
jgi:asparagine synthase (glutamine-hydrolysing)